jgi:hypothetical protein
VAFGLLKASLYLSYLLFMGAQWATMGENKEKKERERNLA